MILGLNINLPLTINTKILQTENLVSNCAHECEVVVAQLQVHVSTAVKAVILMAHILNFACIIAIINNNL